MSIPPLVTLCHLPLENFLLTRYAKYRLVILVENLLFWTREAYACTKVRLLWFGVGLSQMRYELQTNESALFVCL
jgi:hypothetical protein